MKPLKLILPVAAFSALVAAPLGVSARSPGNDSPGFYVGGGIGYNRIQDEQFPNQNDDLDDSNESYKAVAGYRINRIFEVEGQYLDFGTAEGGNNRIDATGFTVNGVANVPLFTYVTPYAKAGVLLWNADRRFPVTGPGVPAGTFQERDGDGEDFTYGVGVKFDLTPKLDLKAEYERFEFGDMDPGPNNNIDGAEADLGSVNLIYNF